MVLRMLLILVAAAGLSLAGCEKKEPAPAETGEAVVEEAKKVVEEAEPVVEKTVEEAVKAAEHPEK